MNDRIRSQTELDGMIGLLSALRAASQDPRIPVEFGEQILDMAERLQHKLRDSLATHYEGD